MFFEEKKIFEEQKVKVLKYILYKKRTENEVRKKFEKNIDANMLEDIIIYLKDAKYIDDKEYINKTINNFQILKNLSLNEVKNKLLIKGINKNDIEDYFYENMEELQQYELKSIKNIILKKQNDLELDKIKILLAKKGYKKDNVDLVIEEMGYK